MPSSGDPRECDANTPEYVRRRRFRVKHALITAAIMLIAVACLTVSRTVRVGYHKWQMELASRSKYTQPIHQVDGAVRIDPGRGYKAYNYHRQELINLGALRELHYSFQNVHVPSEEFSHFSNLLESGKRPPCIDWQTEGPVIGPDGVPNRPNWMEVTVCCFPQDAAAWDALVAERDVPDYKRRFIAVTKKGSPVVSPSRRH